jgi:predicted ATPase/DNA-binding SARP family transcriptional activator
VQDLSVTLFGLPQIKRGNEPIKIQRRKDLALLIYLLVTSQSQSRDTLATLLWQEEGQTAARSNLRKSLSRLKALMGDDALLISQDQVHIHPDLSIHMDVKDFQARLEQFRHHHPDRNGPEPNLCPACRSGLEEAASLYQADFLDGFLLPDSSTFEEWQFFQAESLRQNLAEVLEQLTRQYTSEENYPIAISYCRRWLAQDRLHEPAQRRLMLLYALNDQPAAVQRQFAECVRLLDEELHVQPEPETIQLFEAIQKKKVTGLPEERFLPERTPGKKESKSFELPEKKVYSLPTYPSLFVGREQELAEMIRVLQDPACRLLTLLGPGGSGKTRLALQAANVLNQNTQELFPDGVCFISLAPLTDPESIAGALISGLKIASQAERGVNTRERLLGYLQSRRLLLVLDNFEHLLGDESIGLISEMIGAAQQSKLLVTSRERLNLLGEYIFRVEGLEIPDEQAPLSKAETESITSAFSALKLFEQSAVRVQPSFAITGQNYATIVQICRIVQGMPLAIEMAACWLEIFSPEEIRDEIARSLDFLQSNLRDLPDRQRSLRAVFDASWSLLDKQARPIMKALSVFRAGFTREAAQAVTGASAKTLLDATNKSWIQRLAGGRYQMHELLRQFCFEKLQQEAVTFEQVKKQYCEYYASYGTTLWQAMKGRDQKSAFTAAGEEFENFNTAWAWLVEKNQIGTAVEDLLPSMFYYAEIRVLTPDLLQMAESTLHLLQRVPLRPERHKWEIILNTALIIPGRFAVYEVIGFGIQKDVIQSIWSLLEQEGASYQADYWSIRLAYAYGMFVNDTTAIRYLERILPELQAPNRSWERAMAQLYLAKLQLPELSYSSQNGPTLERYTLDAVDIFSAVDDELNVSYALLQLGSLQYKQEKLEEAIEQWGLATTGLAGLDEWSAANIAIRLMGDAYLQMGQFAAAFKCFERIARICFEHGHVQDAVGALSKESFEMVRYGDLEEARRIRQQCIDAIEVIGPEYQVGWNYWELGEILRVMGRSQEAAGWYEKAHKAFESFSADNVWKIFYFRGLGDIALAGGDMASASRQFSQSLELARETRHEWAAAYALCGMGRCKLGLGRLQEAREHCLEALQYAFETGDKGINLVALAVYAELLCREGDMEMAARLGSMAGSHYATWHETQTMVADLLSSLQNTMAVPAFEQAQKDGQKMDLQATVGDLIGWQKP